MHATLNTPVMMSLHKVKPILELFLSQRGRAGLDHCVFFWVIHIAAEPEENTHLGVVVQQTVLSFPGYVFRVVNGKPMLTHTIDTIQSSSFPPQQHSKKYI